MKWGTLHFLSTFVWSIGTFVHCHDTCPTFFLIWTLSFLYTWAYSRCPVGEVHGQCLTTCDTSTFPQISYIQAVLFFAFIRSTEKKKTTDAAGNRIPNQSWASQHSSDSATAAVSRFRNLNTLHWLWEKVVINIEGCLQNRTLTKIKALFITGSRLLFRWHKLLRCKAIKGFFPFTLNA